MQNKQSGVTKLITLATTQTALANQLGVTHSAIQQWVKKGFVPQKRIARIIELYPTLTPEELLSPEILEDQKAHQKAQERYERMKRLTTHVFQVGSAKNLTEQLAKKLQVHSGQVLQWMGNGYFPVKIIPRIIKLYPYIKPEDLINPSILNKPKY